MRSTTTIVAVRPDCDIHTHLLRHPGVPAVVNGRTITGRWAYMCDPCFIAHGIGGYGEGRAQRLVVAGTPEGDAEVAEREAVTKRGYHPGMTFDEFEDMVGDGDPGDFL